MSLQDKFPDVELLDDLHFDKQCQTALQKSCRFRLSPTYYESAHFRKSLPILEAKVFCLNYKKCFNLHLLYQKLPQ